MTARTRLLGTATIVALAAAPLTPALAQSADGDGMQGDETMQAQPAPEMQFSDSQLESFVDAAIKVISLRQSYRLEIQAAEDQAEQQALVQQAQQEMVTAIEDTDGITVEAYNEIGQAAQRDEALSQRVAALIQERMPAEGEQPSDEG